MSEASADAGQGERSKASNEASNEANNKGMADEQPVEVRETAPATPMQAAPTQEDATGASVSSATAADVASPDTTDVTATEAATDVAPAVAAQGTQTAPDATAAPTDAPPLQTAQSAQPAQPAQPALAGQHEPGARPGGHSARGAQASADDGYRGPSAPQVPVPVWKRRLFIDRPADLAAFVTEACEATALAIDAEFTTNYRRGPNDPPHRLTLLQFAFDNDYRASYVVDALRLYDLSPLQELLGRAATLKLFHGIGADTQVLATRGLVARGTLDLEAVSRSLFGSHESGLQAMAQRAFGVRLDKSLQRADWSRRPLTAAMVAYAARDAEITFALADWLTANYPAQVARYVVPADEAPPAIAASWVAASLERGRAYPIEDAVEDAGLTDDVAAQTVALRQALGAVQRPPQRARLMRYISDLALTDLAPDLRPALTAPTAEERAGAARALGRLRDRAAETLLRPLLDDPVPDVRQAATLALDNLKSDTPPRLPYRRALGRAQDAHPASDGANLANTISGSPATETPPNGERPAPGGPRRATPTRPPTTAPRMWTTGPADDEPPADDWRAALRARFAPTTEPASDDDQS